MPRLPAHQVTTRNLGAAYPFIAEAGPRTTRCGHRRRPARRLFRLRPLRALRRRGGVATPTWWCSGRSAGGRAPSSRRSCGVRPCSGAGPGSSIPRGSTPIWRTRGVSVPWPCARGVPSVSTRSTLVRTPTTRPRSGRQRAAADGAALLAGQRLSRSRTGAPRAGRVGRGPGRVHPRRRGAHRARGGRGPARPERRCRPLAAHRATRPPRGRARRRAGAAPAGARRPLRHVRRADDRRSGSVLAARRPRPVRALFVGRAGCPDGVCHRLVAGGAGPDGRQRRRCAAGAAVASSSWWTRPGRSCRTSAWPAGCSRRGSSPAPSASPTWPCCTGCRTCAPSGASDSEQVALAQGLLSDSETRVVYAQSPGELEAAAELLSLSATETDLLPQLRRGIALWKVGQRSFLVQHRLSATERSHRRHRRGHDGGVGRP